MPIPFGANFIEVRKICSIFPDPGSFLQYHFSPTVARLANEPINRFSNELTLLFSQCPGNNGQLCTLMLSQVYLGSYHTSPSFLYITIMHRFYFQSRPNEGL
jgi:hypothetical protein